MNCNPNAPVSVRTCTNVKHVGAFNCYKRCLKIVFKDGFKNIWMMIKKACRFIVSAEMSGWLKTEPDFLIQYKVSSLQKVRIRGLETYFLYTSWQMLKASIKCIQNRFWLRGFCFYIIYIPLLLDMKVRKKIKYCIFTFNF